jgi:hypothetical protein
MKKNAKFIKRIITIIGSLATALSVIAAFFPSVVQSLTDIPYAIQIILIIIVVVLLGLFFMNWKQYQDEVERKFQIEHDATHTYAHLLRDRKYEAQRLSATNPNDEILKHLIEKFAHDTSYSLRDALSALTNADSQSDDLVVSIKILEYIYWDNTTISADKYAATYRTIARSTTPKGAMQLDDARSHKISECTPFIRIFAEGKHDWTGNNLSNKRNIAIVSEDEVERNISYSDTCIKWSEYFDNKIVVPIRVKLCEIDSTYEGSDERNLFGFVCVEYKKRKTLKAIDKFDKELISYLDLLKTYADTMYMVFDDIYKHMSYYKNTDTSSEAVVENPSSVSNN